MSDRAGLADHNARCASIRVILLAVCLRSWSRMCDVLRSVRLTHLSKVFEMILGREDSTFTIDTETAAALSVDVFGFVHPWLVLQKLFRPNRHVMEMIASNEMDEQLQRALMRRFCNAIVAHDTEMYDILRETIFSGDKLPDWAARQILYHLTPEQRVFYVTRARSRRPIDLHTVEGLMLDGIPPDEIMAKTAANEKPVPPPEASREYPCLVFPGPVLRGTHGYGRYVDTMVMDLCGVPVPSAFRHRLARTKCREALREVLLASRRDFPEDVADLVAKYLP